MRKNKKFLVVTTSLVCLICFLFVMFASLFSTVRADTVSDLKKKLQNAQSQKSKAESNLNSVRNDKKNIAAEKEALDKQISVVEDDIYVFEQAISKNEAEIAVKESELAEAEAKAEAYDADFKSRARVMYERGSASYLEVIFGSKSFSDFLYRVEMVKQIVEYDKAVLKKMAEARQIIKDAKTEIENQRDQKVLNVQILETKKSQLNSQLAARDNIYKELASRESEYKKMLDDADAEAAKLIAQINAVPSTYTPSSGSVKYSGEKFTWPTPSCSNISSPFGSRMHPIQKRVITHNGIDISAAYGAAIVSAAEGKVANAGWNGSYGRYIVVDHGGGFKTLYAHCSTLLVSSGDVVSRGQTIAKVGSTGNSTGPHLHFEVLVNGAQVNPMGYFN
jgi:murein DD-endopeptidase MepM/ murein hydrolase activator NlpD